MDIIVLAYSAQELHAPYPPGWQCSPEAPHCNRQPPPTPSSQPAPAQTPAVSTMATDQLGEAQPTATTQLNAQSSSCMCLTGPDPKASPCMQLAGTDSGNRRRDQRHERALFSQQKLRHSPATPAITLGHPDGHPTMAV